MKFCVCNIAQHQSPGSFIDLQCEHWKGLISLLLGYFSTRPYVVLPI